MITPYFRSAILQRNNRKKYDDETKNDYRYFFHSYQFAETGNAVGHSPLEMV